MNLIVKMVLILQKILMITYDSTEDFYTNDSTTPSPVNNKHTRAFWHNDGTFNDNESTDGGGVSNNEVSCLHTLLSVNRSS